MAARSADFATSDFLDPNEAKNVPVLHRARSGGYADHIEEKVKWERAGRERAMKKYHDQKHPKKPQQAESLYVPTFEPSGHRRVQSYGELKGAQAPTERPYKVREVKPSDFKLSDDSEIPIRLQRKATEKEPEPQKPRRRPTVEIHQNRKPRTPKTSPAASSRLGTSPSSATATSPKSPRIPQLQFQFTSLQNKFAEIDSVCARNFHVEPADPRDLTFAKIAEEVKSHAFNLQVWEHTVNLRSLERIERSKRPIVEHASRTLDRLLERTAQLCDACAVARPRDLKFEAVPEVDDDSELEDDEDDEEESVKDITQSLDFEIRSYLDSISLQIRTLSRLTRSLQEAAPEAEAEVVAVSGLVKEVKKYFGSTEAVERYEIDNRFAGKKALDEAKHTARTIV